MTFSPEPEPLLKIPLKKTLESELEPAFLKISGAGAGSENLQYFFKIRSISITPGAFFDICRSYDTHLRSNTSLIGSIIFL